MMELKRLVGLVALLTVLVSSIGFASPTVAQVGPGNSEAARFCREVEADGFLGPTGVTRGECINIFAGPASKNATNFFAGLCGDERTQERVGTTNKGQCIKVLTAMPS